jgi:hypothetical protein
LAIWVARFGQFGSPSAMSRIFVSPLTRALRRVATIPSSSAKVSPTSTKTGSKTI